MKKLKTKNILLTVGIVILLAVIVYVRSRISPLFGNYSVEKNEKKVEAKPTMDTKSQETKLKTTKPQATKGILYHLKIEQASDLKIPTKRLSLGYFYVQKNRIMRIWENNDYEAQGNVWTLSKKTLNRIIKTSEIPKYSTIVWQK